MSRPARITQRQVPQHIAALQPFKAAALSGRDEAPHGWGHLKAYDLQMYRSAQTRIDYVVLSYSTPIAWHLPDYGWHVVDTRFSVKTSRHQSLVRRGLATHAIEVAQQQTSMATAADAAAVVDGEA
jgi:hypothetical protein